MTQHLDSRIYIDDHDILSPEETRALIIKAQKKKYADKKDGIDEQDTINAQNKLVEHNQKFIVKISNEFRYAIGGAITIMDIFQSGCEGFMKAIDKFDIEEESSLINYASYWIRQSIHEFLDTEGSLIRKPSNKIATSRKVDKIRKNWLSSHQLEPTIREIAIELLIKKYKDNGNGEIVTIDDDFLEKHKNELTNCENEINIILSSSYSPPSSLDDSVNGESKMTSYDITPNSKSSPLNNISSKEDLAILIDSLNILTAREKLVLILRYGIGMPCGFGFKEIGNRLNITRERAKQIKDKAIGTLKKHFKDKEDKFLFDFEKVA